MLTFDIQIIYFFYLLYVYYFMVHICGFAHSHADCGVCVFVMYLPAGLKALELSGLVWAFCCSQCDLYVGLSRPSPQLVCEHLVGGFFSLCNQLLP